MTSAQRIAAIFACTAAAIFGQSGTFTIAGVTVEHGTKQPVARVLVTIMMTDGSRREKACITDASGRFRFDDVPAGKYILNAERPGGLPQPFHGSDQFVTGIAVGPGRDSRHIVFELSTGASISGTVTDDEGEPVRQAQVYLLRKGVFDGRAQLRLRRSKAASASGRFRFDRLPAGTYLVAVSARPWYSMSLPLAPDPQLDLAYPVTYYSNTTDPASATPIALPEGSSIRIQIALHAVPAVHIHIDQPSPRPGQGISPYFRAIGPGGLPIGISFGLSYRNGHLESSGLAPGQYIMAVRTFQKGGWTAAGQKLVSIQSGSDPVITDEPAASVSGKVAFSPPDHPPGIGISLWPLSGRRQMNTLPSDGSFQFTETPPGRYRIQLANAPEFVITQVMAKGADYDSGILEVAPGANVQLAITASLAQSHVDGVALRDGKPYPGAMVLLLPLDMKTDQYVGRDQSDSDGTFSVLNVPAGHYILLAIDNGRDLAYRDPAVMAPYRNGVRVVNVPAGTGEKLKITVLTRRN